MTLNRLHFRMAKKITQTGSPAVRAIFLDAQREAESNGPIVDPDPNLERNGIKPGKWLGFPHDRMPPDCPVKVLGMKDQIVYLVSATGSLMAIKKWDNPVLMMAFAPYINYAFWAWPALGPAGEDSDGQPLEPKVKRLERDKCATALIAEAARKPMFDPQDNVRGRGGWKTDDGQFLWHSGGDLWTVRYQLDRDGRPKDHALQSARPTDYMGHFYAKDRAIITPWQTRVERHESPAHSLLQDLGTWNWKRAWLDPILYLGWIASAFMGGALDVRPILFTIGGKGVGKSTLHELTKAVFGDALYTTANTTAAGIYQNIKQDSRPVAVDEFEAKARGDKEQSIIELARQSFSGAKLYRGGQNHEGVEFELRSSFLFSAILHPPLGVQDRSRMAILNLDALDKSHGRQPVVSDEAGRMILRQIMDGWHDFNHVLLPRWRKLLHDVGFDARARDTYGTLLAAAELLVGEHGLIDAGFQYKPGPDGLAMIDHDTLVQALRAATRHEFADQQEKWQDVMNMILTSVIENWTSGKKPTVGSVLEEYERESDLAHAQEQLAAAGLSLRKAGDKTTGYALAVPAKHVALDKIFGHSDYRDGGWTQALRQAPEQIAPKDYASHMVRISKVPSRCILIDMEAYEAFGAKEEE